MKSICHEKLQICYIYIHFRATKTNSCLSCSKGGTNTPTLSNHEGPTADGADSSLYGLQLGTIISIQHQVFR